MEQTSAPPVSAQPPARLSARAHLTSLSRGQRFAAAYGAGIVTIASFGRFGLSGHALVGAIFGSAVIVLTIIDLDRRLIPDAIVLPTLAVVLVLQIAFHPHHTVEWVVASLATAAFFFLPMLLYPAAMGIGDVKLGALLGAALGKSVVAAVFLALLAGGAVALVVLFREGVGARKKAIAFGPFLALGGLVLFFLGGH